MNPGGNLRRFSKWTIERRRYREPPNGSSETTTPHLLPTAHQVAPVPTSPPGPRFRGPAETPYVFDRLPPHSQGARIRLEGSGTIENTHAIDGFDGRGEIIDRSSATVRNAGRGFQDIEEDVWAIAPETEGARRNAWAVVQTNDGRRREQLSKEVDGAFDAQYDTYDTPRARGIRRLGQIVQYPRGYGEVRRWTVEVLRMIDDDFGEYQLRSPNLLGEFLATKEGQAYVWKRLETPMDDAHAKCMVKVFLAMRGLMLDQGRVG